MEKESIRLVSFVPAVIRSRGLLCTCGLAQAEVNTVTLIRKFVVLDRQNVELVLLPKVHARVGHAKVNLFRLIAKQVKFVDKRCIYEKGIY